MRLTKFTERNLPFYHFRHYSIYRQENIIDGEYGECFGESIDCLVSLRGDDYIITDVTIAEYLHRINKGKEDSEELGDNIYKCDSVKLRLLWEIFFETGIHEVELLEERIYGFGGELKEKDLLGREIFVALVSILNHIKSQ